MMTPKERSAAIHMVLTDLVDRACAAFARGNQLGSAYLATLCGMRYNEYGLPYRNLFEHQDIWLFKWFANGYEDYARATKMTEEIKKKLADINKTTISKEEKAARAAATKSFFGLKLW